MRERIIRLLATPVIVFAVPVVGSKAEPAHRPSATAAARNATRATFAGTWYGHTRSLLISPSGSAKESINDGCCTHVIDLRLQLSRISGSPAHASAQARITAVHVHDHRYFSKANPPPHVGETRQLRLGNGVINEPFIQTNYCTLKAQYKGYCGA